MPAAIAGRYRLLCYFGNGLESREVFSTIRLLDREKEFTDLDEQGAAAPRQLPGNRREKTRPGESASESLDKYSGRAADNL